MPRRIPTLLAVIIGAEAVLVMVGWALDIESLTRIMPTGINMKFITAFIFFFCAIGLQLMSQVVWDEDEVARIFLPGISLIVFLVTVTLFIGRILETSTGLEQFFLHKLDPIDPATVFSSEGSPSIPTLINFLVFGLVGIWTLFPGTARARMLKYAGYFMAAIGATAAVGYAFNLPPLYYQVTASAVPIAPNTALMFILLGIGLTQLKSATRQ